MKGYDSSTRFDVLDTNNFDDDNVGELEIVTLHTSIEIDRTSKTVLLVS